MITLTINGQQHQVDVSGDTPLLWVLRDHLGMPGTKFGCGRALCGACTVYLNGQPSRSCVLPVSGAESMEITTIEGLDGKVADAVRDAWVDLDVPQCGYCQSGQIMAASALLAKTPSPSDSDIDNAMSGNLCRCATYARIKRAIKTAANELEGQSDA